jgi:hypothetical protein
MNHPRNDGHPAIHFTLPSYLYCCLARYLLIQFIIAVHMSTSAPNGYDSARSRHEDDDLDRWRFAAEVVEVILATPAEWSSRIGIFGKWGSGKSTVLRFTEQQLRESKNIVIWFNPWAVQDWNELWEDFGNRLSEALSEAGIAVDRTWLRVARSSTAWLGSKGVGQIAKAGAAALGKDKAVDAAFGLVSRWLKYDGPQIRAIQRKVKQGRIVVFIDDLDRCAPELLPQLLLSLRELLDLPGFTFVLAFDDEIVAKALIDNNPAWSDGSDFLEKILDFRFHLPSITEKQKERLVLNTMAKYCPFVPQESTKVIEDLLPNSPRKLKTLIRSLASLKTQIDRHDPDELNWVDMWLAQMLRLESYAFVERLLRGDALDREAGTLYQLLKAPSRNNLESEGQKKNESLTQLIQESGVENSAVVKRMIQLIEAIRSRSSVMFRYSCELAIRPCAVTWKEFRQLFTSWAGDARASVLADWIKQHAANRHVDTEDVEGELFEAIVNRRQTCLAAAAESASIPEHEANTQEAQLLLQMAEQYLLGLDRLGEAEFRRLYGQATYWSGFRKNPSDKHLRLNEETLLLKLCSSASQDLSTHFFEQVYPESVQPFPDEAGAEKKELRDKSLPILFPKAAQEAIAFFSRDGGIRSLTERGRFLAVRYCLFRPDSPVWKTSLRDNLFELICRGRKDFVIYVNARDFFNLLAQGLEHGMEAASREDLVAILSNGELAQCLWETVTSRGIQYRMQIAVIRARQTFIRNGVPEARMPLTDDLRLRLREEELKARPENAQRTETPHGEDSTAADPD